MRKGICILLAGLLSVCAMSVVPAEEETAGIDEVAVLEQRMVQLYQGCQYLVEDFGEDRILELSGLEGEQLDILKDGLAAVGAFFSEGEKETELAEELQEQDETTIRVTNLENMIDAIDEVFMPFEAFTTDFDEDISDPYEETAEEAVAEEETEAEPVIELERSELELRIEDLDTRIATGEIVLSFLQNTLQPAVTRGMPGFEDMTEVAIG